MKGIAAVVGLLLAGSVAAAATLGGIALRAEVAPQLAVAAAADGSLQLAGLRFRGCPKRSLRVLLLREDESGEALINREDVGLPLDFDRTFDRASDSWTLQLALPRHTTAAPLPPPARLELWCRACRRSSGEHGPSAAAGAEAAGELSGLLSSQALPSLHDEEVEAGVRQHPAATSVLVILLDHATLPPPVQRVGGAGPSIGVGAAASAAAAAVSRRRLHAGGSSCQPVTVAGQTFNFSTCVKQPDYELSNGLSMTIHASLEAAPAGNAGSLLRMAIVAQGKATWAAVGLPNEAGQMLGASAIIAYPTASGAEVNGFMLNSLLAKDINAVKGSFPISEATAEVSGAELRAVFTISLPSKAPADLANMEYIYAMGPMTSPYQPGLADHTLGLYPYGSGVLVLTATSATPAAPATPTTPPTAPTAGSGGAGAGDDHEKDEHGDDHGDDDKHKNGDGHGGDGDGDGDRDGRQPGAGSGASAATNSVAGSCELQLPPASAAGAGAPQQGVQNFIGCTQVAGVGSSFWLMWKSQPVPSNPARTVLSLGLNATLTSGYVSVGFPSSPGRMAGATAMILSACTAGSSPDCPAGAQLAQYFLAGTSQSSVKPSNSMAFTNIQAAALNSGQLAGSFDLEVDTPTAAGRRLLLLQQGLNLPLIFAAGPTASDGTPLRHRDEGEATLPVLGSSDGVITSEAGGEGSDDSLKAAHAWLGAIGWGVLVPVGIVMARSFKDTRPPLWFHLHRAIQTLGFVLGTISLGLGFALVEGWETEDYDHAVHRNLGVACTALGATQFTAVVFRPKPGTKYRLAWQRWHAWVGRAAAAVAIANIYYGCIHMWDLGAWAWATYTAVLCVIVGVSVGKDIRDYRLRRSAPPGSPVILDGGGSGPTRPAASLPASPAQPAAPADVEAAGLHSKKGSIQLINGASNGFSDGVHADLIN